MTWRYIFPVMVAGIAVMTGCADKPVEEMMQAETAIQIAQAAGADEDAAEDFSAAAAALADGKSRIERKDYQGGRASALEAFRKAQSAKNKVEAGKRSVKEELGSGQVTLQDEWTQFEEVISKKSLTKAQQDAWETDRMSLDEGFKSIKAHTEAGDYAGAMSYLKQVRDNLVKIKESVK